jgi:hypothetical protein
MVTCPAVVVSACCQVAVTVPSVVQVTGTAVVRPVASVTWTWRPLPGRLVHVQGFAVVLPATGAAWAAVLRRIADENVEAVVDPGDVLFEVRELLGLDGRTGAREVGEVREALS